MSADHVHIVTLSDGTVYHCSCQKGGDHLASQMTPEELMGELVRLREEFTFQISEILESARIQNTQKKHSIDEFEQLPESIQQRIESDMVADLSSRSHQGDLQHYCMMESGRKYICRCFMDRHHTYQEALHENPTA